MTRLRIVSGGQTGVDRAALDVALALGVECGGWCPRGRRADDGTIDEAYPLREAPSADYALRTEWNVRDSDATLIIAAAPLTGGTALTHQLAERMGRPCLVVDPAADDAAATVRTWLEQVNPATLNVAGPRERGGSAFYEGAAGLLRAVLGTLTGDD